MTPKPPPDEQAAWLRRLDKAADARARADRVMEELIADARAAGVPLMAIARHVPYSREWARRIADRIDAERKAAAPDA
ncbi:hypothetical protein ACEZCY_14010 [Streptacidiphilus sp. N1-12]|uniref:Uncharacterized protein n=2 Tax=Streptacidiphilus alkalitolerans TaxID=3342712 RepID=A0ABV6V9H5_9ACTN